MVSFFLNVSITEIDIRPENKLNVNAPEFTVNREVQKTQPIGFFSRNAKFLQHSKSSGNIQHQIQLAVDRQLAAPRTILVSPQLQQLCHVVNPSFNGINISVSEP